MKLPTILAQAAVPTGTGADYARTTPTGLESAAAAGRAVTQEIQEVQASYATAEKQRLAVEARLRKEEQTTQALQIEAGATDAFNALDTRLKYGVRDANDEIVIPPVPANQHLAEWQKGYEAIKKRIMEDTQHDPVVRQGVERLLLKTVVQRRDHARTEQARRQLETDEFGIDTLERDHIKRAALAQNPDERERAENLYRGMIASKGLVLSEKEAQKRLREFPIKVDRAHAFAAVQAGTFKAEEYRHLDAEALAPFIASHLTAQNRRDKQAKEDREATKDTMLSNLMAAALDRSVPVSVLLGRLEEQRKLAGFTDTEVARLHKAITDPTPEKKSDEITWARVTRDVLSTRPRMSEADINGYYDKGLLSLKDRNTALSERRQTLETARREGESVAYRSHQQAEQEILLAVGQVTEMSKLDAIQEKLAAEMIPQLRRRSSAFGGKEDPLRVADELTTRIENVLGQDATMGVFQIRGLLGQYQDPKTADAALASGRISKGEHENLTGLYSKLRTLLDRQEMIRVQRQQRERLKGGKP